MAVPILTADEADKMRAAGKLAASVLDMITPHVASGVTTGELDRLCHRFIEDELDAIPAPLGYGGSGGVPPFPKATCTSVNHVVCHGIPSDTKTLKQGDALNIDVTVIKDGFHGDTSKMFVIGKAPVLINRLVQVTQECMYAGIACVRPGAYLGDIGAAIEAHAKSHRFSVVRDFCGHGIGAVFHDEPQVLHYKTRDKGIRLEAGMAFTIEPMINAGKRDVRVLPDGWTAVTKDHKASAQWEHTLMVTETGFEVFTLRADETPPWE